MFISRSLRLLTIWNLLPDMRVINFVLQAIIYLDRRHYPLVYNKPQERSLYMI